MFTCAQSGIPDAGIESPYRYHALV